MYHSFPLEHSALQLHFVYSKTVTVFRPPRRRRLKPSLLKKHWRREGKNEVIGRKPSRKESVAVVTPDHNVEGDRPKALARQDTTVGSG